MVGSQTLNINISSLAMIFMCKSYPGYVLVGEHGWAVTSASVYKSILLSLLILLHASFDLRCFSWNFHRKKWPESRL